MPEKLQTLLLIFLGLIFFVVRMWRKAQETIRREAQERKLPSSEVRTSPAPRPVRPPGAPSFEEMLRQMQEQNRRGQAPAGPIPPASASKSIIVPSTPERTSAEGRSLERSASSARSLEERPAARPARSLEAPATAPRQAATLPRAATVRQNDYWTREAARPAPATSTAADVAQKLRNPADLRTAFILAEVLKRRYE